MRTKSLHRGQRWGKRKNVKSGGDEEDPPLTLALYWDPRPNKTVNEFESEIAAIRRMNRRLNEKREKDR